MAAPIIEAHGLTKHFGDITAVDGIDFTIGAGATVALLGANGAGKTTTLAMLLGLLSPTSGAITVLGEDMVRHRYRVLGRMNFSSPYVDFPRRLTVVENLTVYGRLYGIEGVAARVQEVCEQFDITAMMDRPVGKLSTGQRTRVALAKALLNKPEILLLDEPTASLDPDIAETVRRLLGDYQRQSGATILLASHNMAEVENMCTDVLIMQRGRIEDRGTPAELVARHGRETLEQVFLDIARDSASAPAAAGAG